ncbi:hypothetical protein [Pseudonocardia alaniniphila]|uniref:Ig-like domain-containing protein n=1 Tax=Pseudonocardia alaniniphila TaxID=75291 RepID=A0ABS9TQ26_9PSEU|nr:hypothetical protein [Pseudonocardia alaniniphila]MCH6170503.1 hypothetical protein [Pseudonocardia alaniniphila]
MKLLRTRQRVLGSVLVAVTLPMLVVAGCTTSIAGEPTSRPGASGQAAPSPQSASPSVVPRASSGFCRLRVTPGGTSISSSGTSSRSSTVNGHTTFSCGSSPVIAVEAVEDAGVTFTADGATVTIAPGSSATVGTAVIEVMRAGDGTAEFQVTPG